MINNKLDNISEGSDKKQLGGNIIKFWIKKYK